MNGIKRIHNNFHLKDLGIDSYNEVILFIRSDSSFFQSEGFEKRTRVIVKHADRSLVATINSVSSDILEGDEVSLSQAGWKALNAKNGDRIGLFHADADESLRFLRSKLFGNSLNQEAFDSILHDIIQGFYSDIHLAAFITACSGDRLSEAEILSMTRSMVNKGDRLNWNHLVLDKHCIGGLPGNRTTIIVVPILASFGLMIPKTSSRAITSPAGTADTMEVFCPVNLSLAKMKAVVQKEGACIAWGGGALTLSPADDIIIRIERALDLDSVGLMISSVLSKKLAAGSTHVLIDMPVGPSAKVRTEREAKRISELFLHVGTQLGMKIEVHQSDGTQPVGRGIGPTLEARDVLSVLQCEDGAPQDLRQRSLDIAGKLLDMSGKTQKGLGRSKAQELLDSGQALKKFHAICEAQGGFQKLSFAKYQQPIFSDKTGTVQSIQNRKLAMLAKLSGAPKFAKAGVDFLSPTGTRVEKGQTLFVIHSESEGQLQYALDYLAQNPNILSIE